MRRITCSAVLSVALTAGALLAGAGPAAAWTQKFSCDKSLHNWTEYGYLNALVSWSSGGGVETNFAMNSSMKPIKAESFVRLFFSDGSTKNLKYTDVDDQSNGGGGITYSNPVNHPGVTKLMFHTYIGPDSNVWGCEEWVYRP
ncbi:hypothetical protein [Actinoplanes sp. TFC3]|uniref:hypothetical protein n=1 Tax=Actinoplanes sp. TFC3 TaxID=1710355 RepID=UPI00082BD57E|nr:hypothetical protein [Actinoplanes sp. TFC3]